MGMITRVRGRLHSITKLDPQIKDEKIAETVCLLSVLFLLPYIGGRGSHAPLLLKLGSVWLATYSFLVLPLLVSANYKYPVRWLRAALMYLPGAARRAVTSGPIANFLSKLYSPLDRCEKVFMKMANLSNMANQLIFFIMCDRVLLCTFSNPDCPHKKATGLYTLMFYNVIAYCVNYIKELIEKEDWSPYVNMAHHSNIKHLAMSATKIVLEWTKAVTFIITVTFMLLVFGLEQGLQNYQPTAFYTAVTWLYYMATEKVFVEMFPTLLCLIKIQRFEALENLYAPVILRTYTVLSSAIFVVGLVVLGNLRFAFAGFYINVYLRTKDALLNCYKQLRNERMVLDQFRYATPEELQEWDDICAVCLSSMKRARVTPCHHLFHSDCLRLCLNASQQCPMCKREYTFL